MRETGAMATGVTEADAIAAGVTEADTMTADVTETDAIARDLDDVDAALKRLDAGTYFTDEVTGAPLDLAWLAAHPLARRATP